MATKTLAATSRRTKPRPAAIKAPTDVHSGGRRAEIDEWLTEWHVEWAFHPAVDVAGFDVEKSLRNQARLGDPVDDEFVHRYADAMKDGATFPGVVAYAGKDGRFVIIDGNHRLVAARTANKGLAVYEVTARAQTLTAMTFEANVRHGKATSEEERVHHALYLVDNGMPKAEAAKRMNVTAAKITKASLQVEAARRADGAGISRRVWDSLPDAMRNRLSQIHTDEALLAAVTLVQDAGLQTSEVFELVASINDTRSGRQQVKIVDAQRQILAERIQDKRSGFVAGKGKRARTPKTALALAMGQVTSLPAPNILTESLGQAEREEYLPRVDEAIHRLTALKQALQD